jgi:ribose-phosphate pyrophosphokinase
MNYSEPRNLGILACPGGEYFADRIIAGLRKIYKKRFDKQASDLSKRYEVPRDSVIKQINFANDILASVPIANGQVNQFRMPKFKVGARYTCFANGEMKTELLESVRGKDLYIVQDVENRLPLAFAEGVERVLSVNDHIFNLLTTVDAAIQAGAEQITLVLPAYPYSRQHKKKGREGLTAARFGQLMEDLGVSRIITLDIHSREIENCFNRCRMENLHASYQIISKLTAITDLAAEDLVVVSPDTGAIDRNKFYASSLQKPLALIYKERDYSKVTKTANDSNITEMKLLGDVHGKTVFMADDMLGAGGTLLKAMRYLKDQGARRVICAVSLPYFSGSAIEDFDEAYKAGLFYRIIGTNAVRHDGLLKKEWFASTDVTGLFAHIVSLVHHNRSLSGLLDNREIIQRLLKRSAAARGQDQLGKDEDPPAAPRT